MKKIYGWNWAAHAPNGKVFKGRSEGTRIPTREALLAELKVGYRNLDFSNFTCEQGPAPGILSPMPGWTFLFGTSRMRAEIDAGIRPYSDTLLPPIELPKKPILTPIWGKR